MNSQMEPDQFFGGMPGFPNMSMGHQMGMVPPMGMGLGLPMGMGMMNPMAMQMPLMPGRVQKKFRCDSQCTAQVTALWHQLASPCLGFATMRQRRRNGSALQLYVQVFHYRTSVIDADLPYYEQCSIQLLRRRYVSATASTKRHGQTTCQE